MAGQVLLSARLTALARLIPACRLVLDIGADHALLPIWLVQQERCQLALATDNRPGPLKKARANIRRARLEQKIKTRQTDGLAGLAPEPDTVVVLAGLGGVEIRRILAQSPYHWPVLVIQAMRDLDYLRSWLDQAGYLIKAETLVRDKGFLYVALRADYRGQPAGLAALELLVGPRILAEKPAYFSDYLTWLYKKLAREVAGQPEKAALLQQLGHLCQESGSTDDR